MMNWLDFFFNAGDPLDNNDLCLLACHTISAFSYLICFSVVFQTFFFFF